MMEAAKASILIDIAVINAAALLLGLIIFRLLRAREPESGWHHHGNVWTEPFDRIDLAAAMVLVGFFMVQVFALPLLAEAGAAGDEGGTAGPPGEAAGELSLDTVIVGSAFSFLMGAGVFAFATTLRGRNAVQLFGLNRLSPLRILAWTVGGLIFAYMVMLAVMELVWKPFFAPVWEQGDDLQGIVETLLTSTDPAVRIAIAVSAVLVAPVVEEVMFRGFLYPIIKRHSDRFFAAVVTGLLFALVHANVPTLLPLFALAMVLTLAYELTGCLWVPIAIHALFNGVQTVLMFSLGHG